MKKDEVVRGSAGPVSVALSVEIAFTPDAQRAVNSLRGAESALYSQVIAAHQKLTKDRGTYYEDGEIIETSRGRDAWVSVSGVVLHVCDIDQKPEIKSFCFRNHLK